MFIAQQLSHALKVLQEESGTWVQNYLDDYGTVESITKECEEYQQQEGIPLFRR